MKSDSEKFADYATSNIPLAIIGKVEGFMFQGLLRDFIATIKQPNAIIKGLRDTRDFEYEKNHQY